MKHDLFCVMSIALLLCGNLPAAQAQYASGGNGSSPVLKGCNVANAAPLLSDNTGPTSCGANSTATGQLAGSVWTAVFAAGGTVSSGSNWVSRAVVDYSNPIAQYKVTFKTAFINTPVCIAAPVLGVFNRYLPVSTGGTTKTQTNLYLQDFPPGDPTLQIVKLICSVGQ